MNRNALAVGARRRSEPRRRSSLGRGRALLAGLLLMLTAIGGVPAIPAHAASAPLLVLATDVRAGEQYVFSMGIVDRVSAESLTLRFDDGYTETYTLNGATTIQTQNGDALSLADLEVGEMVIVLTVENDPVAVTIVSGGAEGFHDAGPGDIRGHDEDECASCDAHSP